MRAGVAIRSIGPGIELDIRIGAEEKIKTRIVKIVKKNRQFRKTLVDPGFFIAVAVLMDHVLVFMSQHAKGVAFIQINRVCADIEHFVGV